MHDRGENVKSEIFKDGHLGESKYAEGRRSSIDGKCSRRLEPVRNANLFRMKGGRRVVNKIACKY